MLLNWRRKKKRWFVFLIFMNTVWKKHIDFSSPLFWVMTSIWKIIPLLPFIPLMTLVRFMLSSDRCAFRTLWFKSTGIPIIFQRESTGSRAEGRGSAWTQSWPWNVTHLQIGTAALCSHTLQWMHRKKTEPATMLQPAAVAPHWDYEYIWVGLWIYRDFLKAQLSACSPGQATRQQPGDLSVGLSQAQLLVPHRLSLLFFFCFFF